MGNPKTQMERIKRLLRRGKTIVFGPGDEKNMDAALDELEGEQ